MSRTKDIEAPPESDRFLVAPHPRETQALFGHARAETQILDAYRAGRLPQAWIIGGREGIGKATLAWRFARFVLAHPDPAAHLVQQATDLSVSADHPVAKRVNALSHGDLLLVRREWDTKTKKHFTRIRADEVRRLIDLYRQAAGEGGWRIAILDAADDLNKESANALLKLIEEPPSRSLFLLVAHNPADLLPTIRSRARMLILEPLSLDDTIRAMKQAGEPWSRTTEDDLRAAAERSHGSVRAAMRLLDGSGLSLARTLDGLLGHLPDVDWLAVHDLADTLTGREATEDFETMITAVFDWIDATVRASAGAGVARLAPFAEVWEKIAASARDVETYNLDRRPLIMSIFADLAAATRTARS